MLLLGRAEISLGTHRGAKGGREPVSCAAREGEALRREAIRGEHGQTLIIVVVALPLFLALIALVSDGSNLFANKRSVQNVADASVLAAVSQLNSDLSLCTGPASTAGTCLNKVQTVASDYSQRNNGPTTIGPCIDSSSTNCFQTPYPGDSDTGALQVRITRNVPLSFGGVVGLSTSSVSAKAVAGLSLPGAAKNVSPVAMQKDNVLCNPSSCPATPVQIDFDSTAFGYALLNLHCAWTSPNSSCGTTSNVSEMNGYIQTGFQGPTATISVDGVAATPGLLPVNKWYIQNNGVKNGVKQGFDYAADPANGVTLLIPVFDCAYLASPVTTSCTPVAWQPDAYHVIGFAAFVVETVIIWNNGQNGGHQIRGHFVRYIASGVGGGGGGTDFGVHVLTLNE